MAAAPENRARQRSFRSSRWGSDDPPAEHGKAVCRAKGSRFSNGKKGKRSTQCKTRTSSLPYLAGWPRSQT
jgi:hypothetical protein